MRSHSSSVLAVPISPGVAGVLFLAAVLLVACAIPAVDDRPFSIGSMTINGRTSPHGLVQELLAVVERLKRQGVTMVIVEQSVDVALAIADRAVFMERGQVRFQGPAQDLLGRDDLLRAVFLSGAGA